MKILVVFYSMYGHTYRMAQAVVEGAKEVQGAEVELKRVPETVPQEILAKSGALEAQKQFAHVPIVELDDLPKADGILFGSPTRFGHICSQMQQFLDTTGPLWAKGALIGKVGSVFTSTGTQHGGQEATLLSFMTTLFHHGMIVVGLPYSFQGQMRMDEITGCTPYGASTITGPKGDRMPSENELAGARFQGRYVAEIVAKLIRP